MSPIIASQIEEKLAAVSYESACSALAVANTPLFLVRKLQASSAVDEIASKLSASEMLTAIRVRGRRKPKLIQDLVIPYVLLVALSRREPAALRKAKRISPKYHHWYHSIADHLDQIAVPTNVAKYGVVSRPQTSQVSVAGTSTSFHQPFGIRQ